MNFNKFINSSTFSVEDEGKNQSNVIEMNHRPWLTQASMSCRERLSVVTDVEYTFTAIPIDA